MTTDTKPKAQKCFRCKKVGGWTCRYCGRKVCAHLSSHKEGSVASCQPCTRLIQKNVCPRGCGVALTDDHGRSPCARGILRD